MSKRFRESTSTDPTGEDFSSSAIRIDGVFLDHGYYESKRRRRTADLDMALQNVLDSFARDNFDTAVAFSIKVRSNSDHDLARWSRNTQGLLAIASIVVKSSCFPIQQCMFQSLCLILRALANGNFRFDFDKSLESLPALIRDLLPSFVNETDSVSLSLLMVIDVSEL